MEAQCKVTSRIRGGGKHSHTKSKAKKKGAASPERQPKSDKGSASQERGREESLEELRSSISEEGHDDEVDGKMKQFLVEVKKACCIPGERSGEVRDVRGRSREG